MKNSEAPLFLSNHLIRSACSWGSDKNEHYGSSNCFLLDFVIQEWIFINQTNLIMRHLFTTLLLSISIIAFNQSADPLFWKGDIIRSSVSTSFLVKVDSSFYSLENNGSLWVEQGKIPSENIAKYEYTEDLWAFAESGEILLSSDKGMTWSTQFKNPDNSQSKGYVYGGYIYSSNYQNLYRRPIDGSTNWEVFYEGDTHNVSFNSNGDIYISFYDAGKMYRIDGNSGNIVDISRTGELETLSTTEAFAFKGDRVIISTWWQGVLYSDDKGANWTRSNGLAEVGGAREIIVRGDKIYTHVVDQIQNNGWYVSEDGGENFLAIMDELGIWTINHAANLAIDSDNNLYASFAYKGFYFSSDQGNNWTEINNDFDNNKPHHVHRFRENDQGDLFAMMTQKGLGPRALATWGIIKSTNQGQSWMSIDKELDPYYRTLEDFVVMDNGGLVVSAYYPGNIFFSSDDGQSWDSIRLANVTSTIHQLEIESNSDTIWGATYWSGLIKSGDGGRTWTNVYPVGDEPILEEGFNKDWKHGVADFTLTEDTIIAVCSDQINYHGLYRSVNKGLTWETIFDESIRVIQVARAGELIAIRTTNSVYISTDNGDTWELISDNSFENEFITNLEVFQKPSDLKSTESEYVIFISTHNGLFSTSTDDTEWQHLAEEAPSTIFFSETTNTLLVSTGDVLVEETVAEVLAIANRMETNGINLSVYPNLFSSSISIDTDDKSVVFAEVYTLDGRKVIDYRIMESESELKLSGLDTGPYVLRVYSKESNSMGYTLIIKK